MGELLRSGQVGNIQLKQLQEQRSVISERWEKTGLLEGLKGATKGTISQLLENQAGYLLEANTTSDIMGFDIIAFPMVRRVFSRLLANEIVSVQPMNLPSGLLFYLDAQVSTNNPTNTTYESVYNSHYNNGGHEYSFGTATTVTAAVTATTGGMTVTVPYSGGEDSLASLQIYVSSANTVTQDSATTTFAISPQTWTHDLFKNNLIAVTIPEDTPSTAPGGGGAAIAGVRSVYNTYKDLEGSSEMTELKLTVSSVTVQVTSRKMKAHWKPELAQDLAAYHSVDAEAELTALLSEELAAEIDREIIRDLINVAPWKTVWQYSRSEVITNQIGTSIPGDPASGYITQKEWNQTLLTQINKISAQIHKSTLRGGANFIVVSSEISAVFDDLEYFHVSDASPEQDQYNMGIERIGTLNGRYQVYRDPYAPANSIIVGHKGKSLLDTGYIYAPYVPLQLTPTMYNPFNFAPVKGILTRYAKKVVNNRFYGAIRTDGVPTFNINELR